MKPSVVIDLVSSDDDEKSPEIRPTTPPRTPVKRAREPLVLFLDEENDEVPVKKPRILTFDSDDEELSPDLLVDDPPQAQAMDSVSDLNNTFDRFSQMSRSGPDVEDVRDADELRMKRYGRSRSYHFQSHNLVQAFRQLSIEY